MKNTDRFSQHIHSLPLQTDREEVAPHDSEVLEHFPMPRYFQIHFEHVHDTTEALQREIKQLRQANAGMEAKLDVLINLLIGTHTNLS